MSPKESKLHYPEKSLWQFLVAILLVVLPVLMILFNGNRAFNGIFWERPQVITTGNATFSDQENAVTVEMKVRKNAPVFGVYDPEGRFSADTCFALEQVYISWINFDASALHSRIENIKRQKRIPVINIEPWSKAGKENTLMQDIIYSKYDAEIQKVIKSLTGFTGEFYFSWGHEMDQDLTKRYPWSGADPQKYIATYKYVADKLKAVPGIESKWIWSPVGKKGCDKYWPGAEYADFIGMPIYSYPAWDKSYYGHIRSFKSWYDEKYALIKQFNKPVIIVEMGVTGSPDYQTFWLQEAFNTIKSDPTIEAILFFYTKDTPGSWGANVETPDWRTNPDVIRGLVNWIRGEYTTRIKK